MRDWSWSAQCARPLRRSAIRRSRRLIDRVCDLIEAHADQNGLPKDFFARLIWKESRFDPNAVSPVGAEGIAQFMPGTAKMRGLANSFDIEQAHSRPRRNIWPK